jgi:deoxyribonuclease V
MILAVDVDYRTAGAVAAGVLFRTWTDCAPARALRTRLDAVAPYVPGQFYKRELPCILALVKCLARLPAVLVVDGYVYLGRERRPGLGKYLYNALNGRAAVVGVAKSRFKGTPTAAKVLRGGSRRPLYVTALGMSATEARRHVVSMCGAHRVPRLLRVVDQLSRRKGPLTS